MQKQLNILLKTCAGLKPFEKVLIVSDHNTSKIGEALARSARKISKLTTHLVIPALKMHGQEPPKYVADKMERSAVIIGLTKMSMAHTKARFNASNAGARYLSLPEYSLSVLKSPALLADFHSLTPLADYLAKQLTKGNKIILTTKKGTELICSIKGRTGNSCPGYCWKPGTLASPPDAESNIALIENSANGTIIVDGSIPHEKLGLLKKPVKFIIKDGSIVKISGYKAKVLNKIFDSQKNYKTRITAEFGIGLNPSARLRGYMLEDEGCKGTAHIGIGSNVTIGGKNSVPFHLDLVICNVTLSIDNHLIIRNGKIQKEK